MCEASYNNPDVGLGKLVAVFQSADPRVLMPKGQFVVMKTGFYPMKVKLFFKWGIAFDENNPYEIPDQGNRKVEYAVKKDIMDGIVKKYRPDLLEPLVPQDENGASGGQEQQMTEKNETRPAGQQDKEKRRGGATALQTAPRNRRNQQPVTVQEQEVKSDGQA